MAILQVFQTRLLKSLDEEVPDLESFRKLCTADLAQEVRRRMGNLVVLQQHVLLTFTELCDSDKSILLDAPVNP